MERDLNKLIEMDKEEQIEKEINLLNEKINEFEKENLIIRQEYEIKIAKLKQKNFERKNIIQDQEISQVHFLNIRKYLKKKSIEYKKKLEY